MRVVLPGRVVIDASVWGSWFLVGDSNHQRSVTWLNAFMQLPGHMFAPTFLVVEVASAIERATKDEARARRATGGLQALTALTLVPVDDPLIKDATYIASHYSLRAGDALYVAVAQQLAVPLVTFDRQQLDMATSITTIEP